MFCTMFCYSVFGSAKFFSLITKFLVNVVTFEHNNNFIFCLREKQSIMSKVKSKQ